MSNPADAADNTAQTGVDTAGNAMFRTSATPPHNTTDLQHLQRLQTQPEPDGPVPLPQPKTRQPVERLHGRQTAVDSVFAELQLQSHFHEAAQQDHPERHKTGFRTQCRCRNQFAGPNNGRRHNETGTEVLQLPGNGCGGQLDTVGGKSV